MDPASAKELAAAMAVLAGLVDKLGAGGVLGLMVGSPLLMVMTFSFQGWWSARRMQHMLECYRDDNLTRQEENRRIIYDLWEKHRVESDKTLDRFGLCQAETTRYYENNVDLVKSYDRMATDLHALVTTTVRSVEQLAASVRALIRERDL